jgi:hypothetical protein
VGPKDSIPSNAKENRGEPASYRHVAGVLRITGSCSLKDALALVDVRVLDHIIVGDGEGTSLAERGLI